MQNLLSVIQTTLNHPIDDGLQAWIDLLSIGWIFGQRHTLLGVEVNAFGDDRVHILSTTVYIEQITRAQRIGQRILKRTQVIIHFGRHQRGQIMLAKLFFLVQDLTRMCKSINSRLDAVR
jgi:hypothetical protein